MVILGSQLSVNRLAENAKTYLDLGYSVIPVWGNKNIQKAKVAALPWSYFQQRYATYDDVDHWYQQKNYGGLAIVTGRISGLIVIDFDDDSLVQKFAAGFPQSV